MAVIISVIGKADTAAFLKAQKELDKLKSSAVKNAGGFKGAMSSIGSAVTSTGAKIVAGLAAAGVARWLAESIKKAQEMAGTQALLKTAVVNTGTAWGPYSQQMEAAVRAGSSLSGFFDDELRASLTQMTITTGSSSAGLKTLGTVMDLARAKNISTSQAAVLLGKAYDGNVTSLKRLGIMLPAGTKGLAAIDAVQKRVAGSAAAYGETSAGAQAKFNAKLEELQETVGTKIMPAFSGFLKILGNAFDWFGKLSPATQTVIASVAGFAGLATMLMPFMTTIATIAGAMRLASVAQAVWTAAQWLFNVAVSANPIGLIIIAIVALVAVIVYAWNNCQQFRNVVMAVWGAIKTASIALWAAISGAFAAGVAWIVGTWNKIKSTATALWTGLVAAFKQYGALILAVLMGPIGLLVLFLANNWGRIKAGAISAWNAILAFLRSIPGKILAGFSAANTLLLNIGRNIINGLLSGIKGAWNAVVAFLTGGRAKIIGVFSAASTLLLNAGRNIVAGLRSGISNAWGNMVGWFRGLFGDLIGIAKRILGIKSPSTVFAGIGEHIASGLANGITGGLGAVKSAAAGLASAATFSANGSFAMAGGGSYTPGAYSGRASGSSSSQVYIAPGAVQISVPAGASPRAAAQLGRSAADAFLETVAREKKRL